MAFTDPQTVTISGTANSLARISSGSGTGVFASSDQSIVLDIRNAYGKRVRRTIGITTKKLSADPLRPDQNIPVQATVRLVVDSPIQGMSPADLEAAISGFFTNLTASTNANLKKFLGGEN